MVTVQGMQLVLLVFALVGFAGAGAAVAVIRSRWLIEGERDLGLAGIAGMFAVFGTLCTIAASGLFGVLVFGGIVVWASYILMARHLGLFRIEAHTRPPPERERTRHHS